MQSCVPVLYSMLESVDVKLVPMILMLIQCIIINIVYIQGDSYEWLWCAEVQYAI